MSYPAEFLEEFHRHYQVPSAPDGEVFTRTRSAFLEQVLGSPGLWDLFRDPAALPEGWGPGLDPRVIEYPWLLAQGLTGRTLDAGSILNHDFILPYALETVESLHILTLAPETQAFWQLGISYCYADLRDLPYRDGYFDSVACISTLEHVATDNSLFYGAEATSQLEDPTPEVVKAVRELRRVTRPGGKILITAPYGNPEHHGWLRQFDRGSCDAVVEALEAEAIDLRIYQYSASGWQLSDLEQAAECSFRDYHHNKEPADDGAAAARAVLCLRAVR